MLIVLRSLLDCMEALYWKVSEVNMMEDIGIVSVYGITNGKKKFPVSLRIEEEKDA